MTKAIKYYALLLLATVTMFGCSEYDDSELRNNVSDLQSRVEKLEKWCETTNTQISALQGVVTALEAKDFVTGVTPITEGSVTVGYTITFSRSNAVTIKNGTNGKDGVNGTAPVIGVAKHTDGLYYWTVKAGAADATWMLDADGKMIRTTGDKGADGNIGVDGKTPVLSVAADTDGKLYWKLNGEWLMSDGKKVQATGDKGETGAAGSAGSAGEDGKDGEDGDSIFKKDGIDLTDPNNVTLTLADGTTKITFPRTGAVKIFDSFDNFKIGALDTATPLTLALNIKDADYKAIKAELTSSAGLRTAIQTRAAGTPWQVAITAPTFADGAIATQPVVSITVPTGTTEDDIALLKVTVIDSKGDEHASTLVVVYGEKKVYFADAKFRAVLKEIIPGLQITNDDIDPNSATNKPLIEATKELNLYNKGITSLQGIEYFTALEKLVCTTNALTSLDVSKNGALKILVCIMNRLTTLILPETGTLEEIRCYANQLTTLDVSKQTGLTELQCSDNKLSALDVSKCTKLKTFTVALNKLTSLDVSNNKELESLHCYNNQLSTLDISMLGSLDFNDVYCGVQKDASDADRTLELTVTAAQKALFKSSDTNNAGVTLKEKAIAITWATGNLVAKADGSGCEISTSPTAGGLFFQFGSLVGWSAEDPLTIAVKPTAFNGKEDWAETGKIWQGRMGTVPFTVKDSGSNDEKAGIGDPCRYYLGETWRLPTKDEYAALIKDGNYFSGTWKWENSSATNATAGLTFPAAGSRDNRDGSLHDVRTFGYCWSASPNDIESGCGLSFNSSSVYPYIDYRAAGLPVRCVR